MIGKCLRCTNGQTWVEYDNGWQETCIQCGYSRSIKIEKDSKELRKQYQSVSVSDESPSMCRCVMYDTIPVFARQSYLGQDRRSI